MSSGTGTEEKRITVSTADEAGVWDARLRAPDCTDADRARFAAWRDADPAHHAAFEKLQTIVATLRHDRSRADMRALRDEALRAVGTRRRQRAWWVAAAAGLIAFGIGLGFSPLSDFFARLTGTEIYTTGTGQRSTFTLKDGSTVELNAQSRIHVAYRESLRRVQLVQGQALFNVAQNSRRPFIVRAGDRSIVAIGTQFDVRLDAHSVRVTLIEGKVSISSFSSTLAPAGGEGQGEGSSSILLTPGKQLITSIDSPRRKAASLVRDIDVAKVTGWRDGRVFLDDLPLADAVAEMNRYSSIQIAVEDPQLAQRRVNGMFVAGEQEAFVTALEDYFSIVVERRGDREIVLTAGR